MHGCSICSSPPAPGSDPTDMATTCATTNYSCNIAKNSINPTQSLIAERVDLLPPESAANMLLTFSFQYWEPNRQYLNMLRHHKKHVNLVLKSNFQKTQMSTCHVHKFVSFYLTIRRNLVWHVWHSLAAASLLRSLWYTRSHLSFILSYKCPFVGMNDKFFTENWRADKNVSIIISSFRNLPTHGGFDGNQWDPITSTALSFVSFPYIIQQP